MNYTFDVESASKYGVEESIILQNLIFWINKNKANGEHLYDGKTWTYNSVKSFTVLFPFWSSRQIERILKSLKDQNVIITGNYNKSPYDKTTWYALTNEDEYLIGTRIDGLPKCVNGNSETVEPIPDIKPDIKEDVTPLFSENTPEYCLSKKMYDEILSNRSTMKKPDIQKWCISFDLIHRIDKRDYDWLMELISLVYKDNFWKNQIRSPEKLRKQLNEGKLDYLANQIKTWETDEKVIEALNA